MVASVYSILVTVYTLQQKQTDFTSSLILEIKLYGKTCEMVVLETPLLGTQRQSYACSNGLETKEKSSKNTFTSL